MKTFSKAVATALVLTLAGAVASGLVASTALAAPQIAEPEASILKRCRSCD